MIPDWLFGPSGDLRPLPPPDTDIGHVVERFGGTHVGISGGRTVDVLGFRASYELGLSHINPDEFFWIESLYTQTIPGPFHLIDPLRKNLLTREAVKAAPVDALKRGLEAKNESTVLWELAKDSPVPWMQRAALWDGFADSTAGSVQIDAGVRVPVLPGNSMTFSAYLYPSEAVDLTPSADTYDRDMSVGSVSNTAVSLPAGTWTRLVSTFSFGADVTEVDFELTYSAGGVSTTTARILAPQVEYGTEATSPEPGGGAVQVAIDGLDVTSPRYPTESLTLSLLEV